MVITDREIQKDLEDQDQDNHKNNRQSESESNTSGMKLITDLNMEETKETIAQIKSQMDKVETGRNSP